MFNNMLKPVQFLRFCTVGAGNTAVDFTVFSLLTLAGAPYLLAQALSYLAGVVNSYFLNRKWTFQVDRKASIPEAAGFLTVTGLSLLVTSGLIFLLRDAGHLNLWLSKIAATGAGVIVNFAGNRLWIFADGSCLHGRYPA